MRDLCDVGRSLFVQKVPLSSLSQYRELSQGCRWRCRKAFIHMVLRCSQLRSFEVYWRS